jgi:DNA-binding FadR family transcriptional regulator
MPASPSVAAITLHGDVAQAVAGGSPEQARRAMDDILDESMTRWISCSLPRERV